MTGVMMADEDRPFLARWSHRKAVARESVEKSPATAPDQEANALIPTGGSEQAADEVTADLPAVETLDGSSDYTGFLRRDVPGQLRREALRRAWVTDPKIANFRGFADYDWDYNAPGYGALRLSDNIARLLDHVLPDPDPEPLAESDSAETDLPDSGQDDRPPLTS